MAPLTAEHLSFAYPGSAPVLADFSLSLEAGTITALLGGNGAGKSTVVGLLSGLFRPAAGKVLLAGRAIADYSPGERARRLAVLPQNVTSVLPYTAEEIVRMGRFRRAGNLFAAAGRDDRTIVAELLDKFAITSLRERDFSALSGGEKERVLLAAALAQQPEILLLDEPTAALDLGHAGRLMRYLDEERAKGLAILIVSHDVQLMAVWADTLAVLQNGAISVQGRPAEILSPDLLRRIYGENVGVITSPEKEIVIYPRRK